MARDAKKWCDAPGCNARRLRAADVVFLVAGACTLILAYPFAQSIGMDLHSSFVGDAKFTPLSGIIVLVWLIAVFIGSVRPHGNHFVCLLDACSLPALVIAITALKIQ